VPAVRYVFSASTKCTCIRIILSMACSSYLFRCNSHHLQGELIHYVFLTQRGTRWRSWTRQCGTSRKVAGLISDGVIPAAIWPWIDSASNRTKYRDYFLRVKDGRCVGLTTLPPSCATCLAIWKPQPPGTLRACPDLYWDCFTFNVPF